MILALSAAVVSTAVSQALFSLQRARDSQRAAHLLNQVLTKIDMFGPERLSLEGPLEGAFDPPDDRFSWQAEIAPGTMGHLYQVTVSVRWATARGLQSAKAETLLNDPPKSRDSSLEWTGL